MVAQRPSAKVGLFWELPKSRGAPRSRQCAEVELAWKASRRSNINDSPRYQIARFSSHRWESCTLIDRLRAANKTLSSSNSRAALTGDEKKQRSQRGTLEADRGAVTKSQAVPGWGRPRLDDELALKGILFVLRTGTPWEDLPQEMGFGSGMTCWRRLRDWQAAGVWHRLHLLLLKQLRGAGQLDLSRVSLDGASVPSPRGARTRAPTRQIAASSAARGTSPRIGKASR